MSWILRLFASSTSVLRLRVRLERLSGRPNLPVYEPRREQDVFDRVRAANPGPLDDAELLHVYERIIDVMRTLQRRDI